MHASMRWIFALFLSLCALLVPTSGQAEEGAPKKVYASYYGAFPFGRRAMAFHMRERFHAPPPMHEENKDGNPIRDLPLHSPRMVAHSELTSSESADLAIRRAMRAGIDGFVVNVWLGGGEARRMLHVLMRVAKEKKYPFAVTVCLDAMGVHDPFHNPSVNLTNPETSKKTLTELQDAIDYVMFKFGDHPNLARLNGKPLVFVRESPYLLYCYQQHYGKMITVPKMPPSLVAGKTGAEARAFAEAWYREQRAKASRNEWSQFSAVLKMLRKRAGRDVAIVADLAGWYPTGANSLDPSNAGARNRLADERKIAAQTVAPHCEGITYDDIFEQIDPQGMAQAVRTAGGQWCETFSYQKENLDYRIRKGVFPVGGDRLRTEWERVRETKPALVLIESWNNYPLLTHLSPTFTHYYVPMELTAFFAAWWKQGSPPTPKTDKLFCLYRRYPPGSKVAPGKKYYAEPEQGALEVMAILMQPGTLVLKGRGEDGGDATWEAPAGFSFKQFPLTPGPVEAQLLRDGNAVKALACPEWITDKPFAQDNALVAFSTEFEANHAADWKTPPLARRGQKPFTIGYYGDADEDGLPNWFEMLYFGTWNDKKSMTKAEPDADPDRDRKTNKEEYLARSDPKVKPVAMGASSSVAGLLDTGKKEEPVPDEEILEELEP